MQDVFGTMVYPHALRIVRKVFPANEEKQSLALAFAWYRWKAGAEASPASPPGYWAMVGCYAAIEGREVPGVRKRGREDVYDRLTRWSAGLMNGLADKGPGPDALAEVKELFALMTAKMGRGETHLLHAVRDGAFTERDLMKATQYSRAGVQYLRKRIRKLAKQFGLPRN